MLRNTNSFCRIKKDKRANNIFETFPPKIKVNVMHTGFEMPVFPKGNCHLTVVEVREQQQMSGNASSESIFIGGET